MLAAYDQGLGALHSWQFDNSALRPTHQISTNNPSFDRGQFVAIKSTTDNRLYAAYYDAVDTDIRRAIWNKGNWTELDGMVDGGSDDVGKWLSLAADTDGGWHLAYHNASQLTLRIMSIDAGDAGCYGEDGLGTPLEVTHAAMADAGWPSASFGTHTSIGVLDDGRLVVSFYDAWRTNLMLATCSGSNLQLQLLDGEGQDAHINTDVGRWNSLTVDPLSGRLGIAYHDATHGSLKYISSRDGSLSPVVIDNGLQAEHYVGLAASLDFYSGSDLDEGLPRIAYIDATNRELKLARQSVYGLWNTTTVISLPVSNDTLVGFGPALSLNVNAEQTEYIAFTDWSKEKVSMRVATCNETGCTEATE